MKSLVIAAAVAVLATSAYAQSSMQNSTSPAQKNAATTQKSVSSETRHFVDMAAMTDMFEIQSGQLAQQKANDEAYKSFGQMIVNDHTQSSDKMKSIVQGMNGLQMPTALDNAHKQKLTKLQSESGAAFEKQFKTDQVEGHRQAISLYEKYSKSGDNADLKKFAGDTLPVLRKHLQEAQALPSASAPTVGSSGSRSKR